MIAPWYLTWIPGFLAGVVYASVFEWVLHRYFMHRPVGKFRYPFERHALVHHRIFRADESYHLLSEEDKHTIPMAWWNGPVLIVAGSVPFIIASLLLGTWSILFAAASASAVYYCAYEYLHWCMHAPLDRKVERSWIFYRLNGHHLLHHRYMHKNFNVVLPLADLMFGTLILRSKIQFAQARGPAVPNVQPRNPRRRKPATRPPSGVLR